MHPKFTVAPQDSNPLTEIPGDWTTDDYKKILDLTEYGDTSDLSPDEVRDMAFMSISDLPRNEAAELLMNYVFPEDALTPGQIQNTSHEMDTEKLWEEYPEPAQHRNFYRVASLLYRAYNGGPKPEAREVVIQVKPLKEGKALLENPTPAFVMRLLAAGMNGHALVHRLYEDELKGEQFAAADNIIWSVKSAAQADGSHQLTILSSDYWLEAYDPGVTYECVAYEDTEPEEED